VEINEEIKPINEKSSDMIHVFKEDEELENGKNEIGSIEEKYRTIFENYAVAITIADENEQIISWNKYAEELFNMNGKELAMKHVSTLYPPEEWQKIRAENIRQKGMKHKLETKMIRKGSEPFNVEVSLSVLKGAKGKITGSVAIIKDITEYKRTKKKLVESEAKYKTIFESAIDPIIVLDTDSVFVDVNKQVTKLLGYAKSDLIGKKFNEVNIIDKDSIDIISENFKKRICGEDIGSYEIKAITKDDDIIPVEINAILLYEGKKVVGYLIILRDLSDRLVKENVEKDLIESEKKFREIFDSTSDFLLYLETGVILDINTTALELSGIKKDEIIGRSFSNIKDVFSQEDMTKHLEAVSNACQGVKVNDYECDLITRYGKKYKFLFSTDCIRGKEKIKGILIRGKDITQRQQAWDELVRLEEKYRVLAETSADGVLTIDSLGRLTYVNPSFEKMCGRRKSQILATLFRDYLLDDSVYLFQQVFIDARRNDEKVENIELDLTNTDRGIVPIEANIAPLKNDEGKFVGMICTVRDITGRKEVEDELKKSERLKTEFMNIAAHELKSPVTPIKGYLDLIISDEDASEKIKNWAKVSLRNSERLLRLVNDILDVSRLDSDTMKFDMSVLSSVEILDEIVEDMKPAVEKKSLDFIEEIPRDLPNILGDRYRLSQVLKNLFVNAIKFTDHGSISITAKKEKKYILITVEDTGIGISKSEVKKVFSKFYQAYTGDDRKNEGTGLGLFICKEIVQKHNGKIWAESVIGKGSTFSIKLPYL
jgi:PAS domain S-box-containing protein